MIHKLLLDEESQDGGTVNVEGAGTLDLSGGEQTNETAQPAAPVTEQPQKQQTTLAPKTSSVVPVELTGKEAIGNIREEFGDDNIITEDKLKKEREVAKTDKDSKKVAADKVVTDAAKTVEATKQQQDATKQRDYTIFDQSLVPVLKKLPNDQFDAVKTIAIKNKELATKLDEATKGIVRLPDSYIEHPEAWRFSPEVPQINAQYKQSDLAYNHYREQLAKIEAGEPWQDIADFNADGSLKLSDKIEAKDTTSNDKVAVMERIQNARQYKNEMLAKLESIKQQHSVKHSTITKGIKEQTLAAYPFMSDEKLQANKFNKLDKDGKQVETTVKDAIEMFRGIIPAELKNNILAEPLVATLTANLMLQDLARLNSQKEIVAQQIEKDEKAAEPNITGKTTTKARASGKELIGSLADMRDDD